MHGGESVFLHAAHGLCPEQLQRPPFGVGEWPLINSIVIADLKLCFFKLSYFTLPLNVIHAHVLKTGKMHAFFKGQENIIFDLPS